MEDKVEAAWVLLAGISSGIVDDGSRGKCDSDVKVVVIIKTSTRR